MLNPAFRHQVPVVQSLAVGPRHPRRLCDAVLSVYGDYCHPIHRRLHSGCTAGTAS